METRIVTECPDSGGRSAELVAKPGYRPHLTQATRFPSGTVTLLFTDIQGSTRLWEVREREQGKLKELLGATACSDAYSSGAQLSPEQAMDLALARDPAD